MTKTSGETTYQLNNKHKKSADEVVALNALPWFMYDEVEIWKAGIST